MLIKIGATNARTRPPLICSPA